MELFEISVSKPCCIQLMKLSVAKNLFCISSFGVIRIHFIILELGEVEDQIFKSRQEKEVMFFEEFFSINSSSPLVLKINGFS